MRNEFIDLMEMNELVYKEHEFYIFADIPFLGTVTFYPKKNSLNIHKGNKWEKGNGLIFIKNHLQQKDIVKDLEKLRRFEMIVETNHRGSESVESYENENGQWIRYVDLKDIIKKHKK